MNIKVVEDYIPLEEAKEIAKEFYYPTIKGVIDIEKEIIALGGEYHADARESLLERGCKADTIWGFNIHLDQEKYSPDWVEYTALINIKPSRSNRSMEIISQEIRQRIRKVLEKLIT